MQQEAVSNHENIGNRKKFMRPYLESPLECEPFVRTSRIVYLKKTFEVKAEGLMLFKFSNNNYQVFLSGFDKTLLITEQELVLVTLREGMEVGKHSEPK